MIGIDINHQNEYGVKPEIVIEVPQITTLLGAFSDCISGYAIMSTNDSGMRIAISKRNDNTIRLLNATKQDKKKFQITSIKYRKEDRWANAVKAIVQEILYNGYSLSGMDITIKGKSSLCDNTSLASSLFVGVIWAINELYNFRLKREDIVRISLAANRFSSSFQARYRDLITLLYADNGKIIFFDLDSYEYGFLDYPDIDNISSILISTSIPYSVLTPEMDEFRSKMIELCKEVRERLPRCTKIRDLKEKDLRQNFSLTSEQRRQVMYLIDESGYAKSGFEALKQRDFESFGKILNLQQKGLSFSVDLTSPEIDWIIKRGYEIDNLYGIAHIYVGVPGTLFALIDSSVDFPYTSKLEEYERIFGFHAEVRPYIPSGCVRRLKADEYSSC